jgi:hypothetical protein
MNQEAQLNHLKLKCIKQPNNSTCISMDASALVSAVVIDVPVPIVKWRFVYKVIN